jgi:hypothetical protein
MPRGRIDDINDELEILISEVQCREGESMISTMSWKY